MIDEYKLNERRREKKSTDWNWHLRIFVRGLYICLRMDGWNRYWCWCFCNEKNYSKKLAWMKLIVSEWHSVCCCKRFSLLLSLFAIQLNFASFSEQNVCQFQDTSQSIPRTIGSTVQCKRHLTFIYEMRIVKVEWKRLLTYFNLMEPILNGECIFFLNKSKSTTMNENPTGLISRAETLKLKSRLSVPFFYSIGRTSSKREKNMIEILHIFLLLLSIHCDIVLYFHSTEIDFFWGANISILSNYLTFVLIWFRFKVNKIFHSFCRCNLRQIQIVNGWINFIEINF